MAPALHIRLLGGFCLAYGDTAVTAVNTPRLQSLLAYLVLHRDAPQSRHHLACLLWPDSTEVQARTNLRHLIYQLRHALPDAERFILSHNQTLQWAPDAPCSLDVADVEQAVAAGDLETAVSLYHGDLIPGCYDDWVIPERDRLQLLHIETLERLAQRMEDARDYAGAVAYAQCLLQCDPLREDSHRRLIRLHALRGDRAAALHAYHSCATILRRELAVQPSPATRAAHDHLLRADLQTEPAPLAAALPLVGRTREWRWLLATWRAAAAGQPQMALLAGEAGIGKTRLAEELVAWTARQGIRVASAACYAAEGSLPYAPAVAWLRAMPSPVLEPTWLAELSRLRPELAATHPELPPPGPLAEPWQRQRLFEALARAMLADGQPLLLRVEDLHWCDAETLAWLHYLLRFDPRARLLVVGTLRTGEMVGDHPVAGLLAALRRSGQLGEIELTPLDEEATSALATSVAGRDIGPALAGQLFSQTEGNPLFVVEMVRAALLTRGARSTENGLGTGALPPRVQAAIAARLGQVSPRTRELLDTAATIGRAFTIEVLRRACHGDEESMVRALDELWQRRIIREQGKDSYDFTHDLLREVAYGRLSAARRRWLHRRIAEALENAHVGELGQVSGQIGSHYERGGLRALAIGAYQRAAAAAQKVYASADAISSLEHALALLEELPAAERRTLPVASLHEMLGEVLDLVARHDEARQAYAQALDCLVSPSPVAQAQICRKIGSSWLAQHRYVEAWQAFAEADAALGPAPQGHDPAWWQEHVQLRLEQMACRYQQADWPALASLAAGLKGAVERWGMPRQQSRFLSTGVIGVALYRDRCVISDETLAHARTMLALAQQTNDEALLGQAHHVLGFVLLLHGDLQQAANGLRASLAVAERTGDIIRELRSLIYLALAERRSGHLESARLLGERSLALATATGHGEFVGSVLANRAWIAWREGRPGDAESFALQALEEWRGHPYLFRWTALLPLIAVLLARGEPGPAVDHARSVLEPSQHRLPDAITAALQEAIEAWEQGAISEAHAELQQAVGLAQDMGYL